MTPIIQNIFQFYDLDGSPLQNGSIYFGAINQNPETNPVFVYWDAALTQPAAQPIGTLNGFAVRDGIQGQLYCASSYSMTIRNKKGSIVSSFLDSDLIGLGVLSSQLSTLIAEYSALASTIQNQTWSAFTSSGGAGSFVLTPIPAITSLTTGTRFNVTFNALGTGTDTISINGLTAVNLKQYAPDGTLEAPNIKSGMNTDIVYDGTEFIIMDQLPTANNSEVGKVEWYAGLTDVPGTLICNGAVVPNGIGTVQGKTANFSAIYAFVGTSFGAAGTLPDLRGQFIRGYDNGAGVDAGRVFGSNQTDDYKQHSHTQQSNRNISGYATGTGGTPLNFDYVAGVQTQVSPVTGGTETRPKNIALLARIKYI